VPSEMAPHMRRDAHPRAVALQQIIRQLSTSTATETIDAGSNPPCIRHRDLGAGAVDVMHLILAVQ
jgi:hypothetical protein